MHRQSSLPKWFSELDRKHTRLPFSTENFKSGSGPFAKMCSPQTRPREAIDRKNSSRPKSPFFGFSATVWCHSVNDHFSCLFRRAQSFREDGFECPRVSGKWIWELHRQYAPTFSDSEFYWQSLRTAGQLSATRTLFDGSSRISNHRDVARTSETDKNSKCE